MIGRPRHSATGVATDAGKESIRWDTGSWTHWELRSTGDRLMMVLRRLGLRAGDAVAGPAENVPLVAAALLACRELGLWWLPVDARWPSVQKASRLKSARCWLDGVDSGRALTPARAWGRAGSGGLLHYTSGTTAGGRCVRLPFPQVEHAAAAVIAAAPPRGVWACPMPLAHIGATAVLFRASMAGVPAWILPRHDARHLRAWLSDRRVSHLSLVGKQLASLLDEGDTVPWRPPSSLSFLMLGGGPVDPTLVARARQRALPVHTSYGMTECAAAATLSSADDPHDHPGDAGRPLAHVDLRVVDPDADGCGRITLDGPSLLTGWDDGEARPPGPFDTGDLGVMLPDGRLRILDRATDRIVTGGENVHPADVEAALLLDPDVLEACVVGQPDPEWGHLVCAAVRTRSGRIDPALLSRTNEQLAPWQRPRRIVHWPTPLPRTDGGKLRRGVVREGWEGVGGAESGTGG